MMECLRQKVAIAHSLPQCPMMLVNTNYSTAKDNYLQNFIFYLLLSIFFGEGEGGFGDIGVIPIWESHQSKVKNYSHRLWNL
jgi:hypothetical protein